MSTGADPLECYRLLQVEPGTSRSEIKRAFHRLAKRLHPDVIRQVDMTSPTDVSHRPDTPPLPDPSHGEEWFRKILDAYKTLMDDTIRVLPRERVSYALTLRDVAGHAAGRGGPGRRGGFVNPKGYDVRVELTPRELAGGVEAVVDVPARVVCPVCGGDRVSCSLCSDRGTVLKAVPVRVAVPRDLADGSVFVVSLRDIRRRRYTFFTVKELLVQVRIMSGSWV
jgi:hypothetical protein